MIRYARPSIFHHENGFNFKVLATVNNNAIMESEKGYYACFNVGECRWGYSKFLGFKGDKKLNPFELAKYIKMIM